MKNTNNDNTLAELDKILKERLSASPDTSYVASLHAKGLNKILEKVGEEATETILAAKDAQKSGDTSQLIYETADLWFHTLVMLAELNTDSSAVLKELARRFDLSGLDEKSNREN